LPPLLEKNLGKSPTAPPGKNLSEAHDPGDCYYGRVLSTAPTHNVFCYSSVAHILTPSVNLAFRPKSGFKKKCRAPAGFGLGSGFKLNGYILHPPTVNID